MAKNPVSGMSHEEIQAWLEAPPTRLETYRLITDLSHAIGHLINYGATSGMDQQNALAQLQAALKKLNDVTTHLPVGPDGVGVLMRHVQAIEDMSDG